MSPNSCKLSGEETSTREELQRHRKEAHGLITPVGRSSLSGSIASLALRGFLGTVMIMHGAPKLTKHKEKTIESMEKLGVPNESTISASLLEVAGGAALLTGFFSYGSLCRRDGRNDISKQEKNGKTIPGSGEKPPHELDVMYALAFGILAIIGGGEFSVDRLLKL
jgi:uncharacterized membrane protein YphA (DoxX/SURF4 family)